MNQIEQKLSKTYGTEFKIKIMPRFGGKQSYTSYHKQFGAAATAGRQYDTEKATALTLVLCGDTLDTLQKYQSRKEQSSSTIERGMRHLYQRFQEFIRHN